MWVAFPHWSRLRLFNWGAVAAAKASHPQIRADFWEGDATKQFSVEKKGFFSEKGGGKAVNQGFGKDFYRKGNSVKRFGPFTEPPDSEN